MAKNTGKVREFCQFGKVGTLAVVNFSLLQRSEICNENADEKCPEVYC